MAYVLAGFITFIIALALVGLCLILKGVLNGNV